MIEISHQKAQAFLQAAADSILPANSKVQLDAHLTACKDCREHKKNLRNLEDNLQRISHEQWDNYQPNLNLKAITNPSATRIVLGSLLGLTQGMGKATIVLALVLGYFLIVNLVSDQKFASQTEIPTTLPTPNALVFSAAKSPTPSSPSTLTGLTTQGCENIDYVIQADDTLESIALQFGVSKETIIKHNNLKTDDLSPGKELLIPLCNHTPSHTASTADNTLTITPLIGTLLPTQRE